MTQPTEQELRMATYTLLEQLVTEVKLGSEALRQPRHDTNDLTEKEIYKMGQEFAAKCPTFERGKDKWMHFVRSFKNIKAGFQVTEEQAKRALYGSIKGQASILMSSMLPSEGRYVNMTFDEYLQAMGEKFAPASESEQMKDEYLMRKQGKNEDVGTYLNEKYELYQLAYPLADGRRHELREFFDAATMGLANDVVKSAMYECRPDNVDTFFERAKFLSAVEKKRVDTGLSKGTLDGLMPTTKKTITQTVYMGEPMEVDALREREYGDNQEEEGECECMALQEHGFKNPCYYCQRKGHFIRSCPRKAAGLPKVKEPGKMQSSDKPGYRKGVFPPAPGRGGYSKSSYNQNKKTYGGPTKRVFNLEEDQPERKEEEPEEEVTQDEAELDFLEEGFL